MHPARTFRLSFVFPPHSFRRKLSGIDRPKRIVRIEVMIKDRLLKALLLMFMTTSACLAQTPDDLRRKYGKPETLSLKSSQILVERYAVGRNITITVKFTDQRRACQLRIEPPHSTSGSVVNEVMPADEAYKITEELAPTAERGRLIKTSNVELGCSLVIYQEYERVMIATATRCSQKSGGTYSVNIRWKDTACEGIDRKESASKADGSLNN
jgi:hypothetical protein